MKSLLKLLATLTLATTPTIAVVACNNENKQMTPRDILNSAVAFITDSDLKVKTNLQLPDSTDIKVMEGKTFSEFDGTVKTAIANFFTNKLKKSTDENPTNWYHPDAHVKISDIDNDPEQPDAGKFVLPVKVAVNKPAVNGHLAVKAEISYSNLPPITKNIKLTLNNDTSHSTDQDKVDAIKEFIEKDIANLNVNVENLPISGTIVGTSEKEKVAIAKTQLSYIQQNLNVAIKDKVQYSGLRLSFSFTGDFSANKATLFTMKDASIAADKSIIFNGDINNITISFLVGPAAKADFDTGVVGSATAIKINQTFADATTQIEKIFSQWSVDPVATLPKDNDETYQEYNQKISIEDQFIKNGYFAAINKVYANLGNEWLKQITITNPDSHFNFGDKGDKDYLNGYFSLNFKLEYDLTKIVAETTSKFNINVESVHIKLRKI